MAWYEVFSTPLNASTTLVQITERTVSKVSDTLTDDNSSIVLPLILSWFLLYIWSWITIGVLWGVGWWDTDYALHLIQMLTFIGDDGTLLAFIMGPFIVGGFMGLPLLIASAIILVPLVGFICFIRNS